MSRPVTTSPVGWPLLCMVLMGVLAALSPAVGQAPLEGEGSSLPANRMAGANREETSAIFAHEAASLLGGATVVVVPAAQTAVALAAAGLAGYLDATIILSNDAPAPQVLTEVAAQQPDLLVVAGGSAELAQAWSGAAESVVVLPAEGGPPAVAAWMARQRVASAADRDDTTGVPRAILAGTAALPDALAAAALAYEEGWPLLLTAVAELDPHTAFVLDQLAIPAVTIVGGTAAVSEEVAQVLRSRGMAVERIAGATREETALAIASRRDITGDHIILAAGDDPVDAAAAAPYAASVGAAILPPGSVVRGTLVQQCGAGLLIQVAGGAAAISPQLADAHRAAAERCDGPDEPLRLRVAVGAPEDPDVPAVVVAAIADPRGWASRRIRLGASDADHTLGIIVAPGGCGPATLCRRGRDVVIDAGAWRGASPERRTRMVNMAIGHRLGEDVGVTCAGLVMDPLTCPDDGDPWPTPSEQTEVAERFVPSAIIAFGGDVHAERHIGATVAAGGNPLAPVTDILSSADLAVINLETPLSTRGAPVPKTFTFRGPPEMADRLADAGVDVANLANNHGLDYGLTAMRDTIQAVQNAGVALIGAGETAVEAYAPAVRQTPAGSVAVVGLTRVLHTRTWEATAGRAGLASAYAEAEAVQAVRAAADQADHVVVTIHWGTERADCPNADQRHLARLLADAGADVIVGHHPHVLQGIQDLDGTIVAYSMGNFVWYHNQAPSRFTGILQVELPLLDAARWQFTPAEIGLDGSPHPAVGPLGDSIVARVVNRSPGGAARCGFPAGAG